MLRAFRSLGLAQKSFIRAYHGVKNSPSFLSVHIIPCLTDNYAYLIEDEANKDLFLVDPGDPLPVLVCIADEAQAI